MVRDATHETTEVARPTARAELVLVSNRLPVTMSNEGREVSLRPSTGGLATALSTTHARGASRWVGWLGDTQELSGLARAALREELARARLDTVSLTPLEVKRFYEGFSNSVLWPLFHYFVDKVRLDADRDWEVYRNVNARFAERVAAIAAAASWGAIIAAGDDATDEDMFRALPTDAITIKVGRGISVARFRVDDVATLRSKLVRFTRDELSG